MNKPKLVQRAVSTNPRIMRQFSIVAHNRNIVELRAGVWNPVSYTLTDEAGSGNLFRILSKLDGSASSAGIAQSLSVPRSDVEALIDHLDQIGALETGASSALDYYLDNAAPTLRRDQSRVASRPVMLLGDEPLTSEFRRHLTASLEGVVIHSLPEETEASRILAKNDTSWFQHGLKFQERVAAFESFRDHFLVYLSSSVNPIQLAILNRVALELGIPWITATVDGPFLLVGPTFVPPSSPCFQCLETRVMMNLRESDSYVRYKNALVEAEIQSGHPPLESALASLVASHAALDALNFLLTGSAFGVGKVLSIYLPTMEFAYNEVLRLPGCAACGPVVERDDKELYFDIRALMQAT
jgi:bacteriocin biosynthesis cyclodehydratase domain-containing protein